VAGSAGAEARTGWTETAQRREGSGIQLQLPGLEAEKVPRLHYEDRHGRRGAAELGMMVPQQPFSTMLQGIGAVAELGRSESHLMSVGVVPLRRLSDGLHHGSARPAGHRGSRQPGALVQPKGGSRPSRPIGDSPGEGPDCGRRHVYTPTHRRYYTQSLGHRTGRSAG